MDAFRREDSFAAAFPIDEGHVEVRIVLRIVAQFLRSGSFKTQIKFEADGIGEGLDDLHRLQAAVLRQAALDEMGEPEHEVDIALEGELHFWAQHFHGDFLAIRGGGEMYLGNGGGGDGVFIELREEGFNRGAELFLDHRFGDLRIERRQAVLQFGEIAR